MEFKKISVVIPTRNRSDLAINAIRSVLEQEDCDFELVVSDNSTEGAEVSKLRSFCENLDDQRLRYVRPSEPLSMPKHWEWAKEQALEPDNVSHLCYLTDRMMFRRNALKSLIQKAKLYPDKVISYNCDSVDDSVSPVVLCQLPYTGKLFEVSCDLIIDISASSIWHYSTPRMFNAVVPKSVFQNISRKYGKVFESISPDFCFLYKFLDIESNYLYFDKSLLDGYGLKRSNGTNYGKGIEIKDTVAFFEDIIKDQMIFNQHSPVPEFFTVINAVVNEYAFVKNHQQNLKFLPLKIPEYFRANYRQFLNLENEQLKEEMLNLYEEKLSQYGLSKELAKDEKSLLSKMKNSSLTKTLSGALVIGESRIWGKKLFKLPLRMNEKRTEFNTVKEAIDWADANPLPKRCGLSDLEYLLDVKLPVKRGV